MNKSEVIVDIENAIIAFTSYKGRDISRVTANIHKAFVKSECTDAYQYAMLWIEEFYEEIPA